jgi:hypothetical protein
MAEDNVNIDTNIDASLDDVPDVADGAPSPSRASAVSGTTVKTTFSIEEISELDTDVMLDSLNNLDSASEELLRMLISAIPQPQMKSTTLEEIVVPGTKAYKLYQKRLSAYLLYKGDYISARQDYIQPQNVCRALFDVPSIEGIPPGAMRPDAILYKANLAHMLHVLLVHIRNPAIANYDIVEALEGLDQVFPKVVAGSTFSPAAFTTSLALTTQLAINRMASFIEDPNFNPQGLAEHAFISDSENDTPMFRHHLSLHLDDLSEEHRSMCLDRINGIVAALKGPFDDSTGLDSVDALESVRQTWPWSGFIETNLIPYYMERKDELDKEVNASGGVQNLSASVKKAVQNRDELKSLAAMQANLEQNRRASGRSKRPSLPASALQALRASLPANGPPTQGLAPVAQMTAPQLGGHVSNNKFDMSSTAPQAGGSSLADLSQFQDANQTQKASAGRGRGRGRGKGKANAKSFNDRQSGAQRVGWDESQAHSGIVAYESSVLGKRSRDAEEEQTNHWEPTQDGGPQDEEEDPAFETRYTDNAAADARRSTAPSSVQHARPFLNQPPYFNTEPGSPDMQQRPAKRRNPGSSAPHPGDYMTSTQHPMSQDPNADPNQPPPSTAQAQEYHQAAWTARQYRILNHSTPARERRVWTDLETEALMTYINEWPEEDNLHYAAMKRKDTTEEGLHALNGRTAEDIRFRARNMKVNFLLSRSQDIHPNWTKVQLAKKEIDKLHARGVPYAQAGLRGTPAEMATGVGGSQV